MSIAIYDNENRETTEDLAAVVPFAARHCLSGPLRPTLVFFGGLKGTRKAGGPTVSPLNQPEDGGGPTPSSLALSSLGGLFGTSGLVLDFDPQCLPAQESPAFFGAALGRLSAEFDARAPLVVYGYSSGAFNAVGFCLQLAARHNWYNFSRGRLGKLDAPTEADRRDGGYLRVDLLITVDASIRNYEARHGARFPLPDAPRSLVKRHVNFYQNTAGQETHGFAVGSARNRNQRVPGASHESIPNHRTVVSGVTAEIQGVLAGFRSARAA
jgi:hypothetical protein